MPTFKRWTCCLWIICLCLPMLATAESTAQYLTVIDRQEDGLLLCKTLDFSFNEIYVRPVEEISASKYQAIQEAGIVQIHGNASYRVGSNRVQEAEKIEIPVMYALLDAIDRIDIEANKVNTYVSNIGMVWLTMPEVYPVDDGIRELAQAGARGMRGIRFAPHLLEENQEKNEIALSAENIEELSYAYGYVHKLDGNQLMIEVRSAKSISGKEDAKPIQTFTITESTLHLDHFEEGRELSVIYDEETREVLAVFYYNG